MSSVAYPVLPGRLVVVLSRAPVTTTTDPVTRRRHTQRASGGLVTALQPLLGHPDVHVVSAERADVARGRTLHRRMRRGAHLHIRQLPEEMFHAFYIESASELLWYAHHYLWDPARGPVVDQETYRAWSHGYRAANRQLAQLAVRAAGDVRAPIIWSHDYQTYLVPGTVRALRPDAVIEHFIHVPWPDARYFGLLPPTLRRTILASLVAADLIGVQTQADAVRLLQSIELYLPGTRIDIASQAIHYRGRTAWVRHYPVSVDADALRRIARSRETRQRLEWLRPLLQGRLLLRIDRCEPAKNIVRGFLAFENLLQRRPDLHGRITFLALLVPSRMQIDEYRAYRDEVFAEAGRINARFERDGWQPIRVLYGHDYARAVAALQVYDVLLVNSLADGMNLVAKEGAVLNRRRGVVVLSEAAGAIEELGPWTVNVAPTDVLATSHAIESALAMPLDERVRRSAALRTLVERRSGRAWLERQLDELGHILEHRLAPA